MYMNTLDIMIVVLPARRLTPASATAGVQSGVEPHGERDRQQPRLQPEPRGRVGGALAGQARAAARPHRPGAPWPHAVDIFIGL